LTAADWLDKGNEGEDVHYAIECYTNAIKLYPDFEEAYFNRAIAYEDLADSKLEDLPDDAGSIGAFASGSGVSVFTPHL